MKILIKSVLLTGLLMAQGMAFAADKDESSTGAATTWQQALKNSEVATQASIKQQSDNTKAYIDGQIKQVQSNINLMQDNIANVQKTLTASIQKQGDASQKTISDIQSNLQGTIEQLQGSLNKLQTQINDLKKSKSGS